MRVQWRESPSSRMGFFRHTVRLWFAIGVMAALTACGGGGGGGGSGNPAPGNPPPANTAPQVDAGADQTIQLPNNTITVSGSATDAPGSTLTYAWTASPEEGVTFEDAAAAETTVTFASAGTYTLTLTVSDGSLSGSDSLQVIVQAAATAAPVVEAGEDQEIELPVNTVTLAGSATDEDSTSLTYEWTAEPSAGVTFADATAAETTATFTEPGTYTLTLTASDGEQSGSDSLQVVVNPPVYPAADTNETDPNHGWATASPDEVGMDAASLEAARDYALTGGGSGLIVRYGRMVYSWGDIDQRFDVKSTTKSIGGIALGLALDEQRVTLDDTAQSHLPSFGTAPPHPQANVDSGHLPNITLLQLATHTAGFEKPADDKVSGGTPGYGSLVAEPGTTWLYSDGALNWLADVLTEVYAQDLNTLLSERVWSVLGISGDDVLWRANAWRPQTNSAGIATRELASGMQVNTNAMARVGLLFLRNGVWAGQRILSESFIETVRTPRPEFADLPIANEASFPGATTNYGVLWWTNKTGMLPNVPRDAYWAWGLGDSLIVVIPSLDLVIARAGNDPDVVGLPRWRDDWDGRYEVLAPFLDPIIQSIQE